MYEQGKRTAMALAEKLFPKSKVVWLPEGVNDPCEFVEQGHTISFAVNKLGISCTMDFMIFMKIIMTVMRTMILMKCFDFLLANT